MTLHPSLPAPYTHAHPNPNTNEPTQTSPQVSDWVPGQCEYTCKPGKAVAHGKKTYTRTVIVPPANNGEGCHDLIREEACKVDTCPVDCVTSEWGSFGECSTECGTGTQNRTRVVLSQARNQGEENKSFRWSGAKNMNAFMNEARRAVYLSNIARQRLLEMFSSGTWSSRL